VAGPTPRFVVYKLAATKKSMTIAGHGKRTFFYADPLQSCMLCYISVMKQ
jgi:hypothetical protein